MNDFCVGIEHYMRGIVFNCTQAVVLSILSFTLGSSDVLAKKTSTLSVDVALKQEDIGSVLFDPNSRRVVFERISAYDTAPADSYRYRFFSRLSLSNIYVANTEDDKRAEPIFDQRDDTGYWLGGFSPKGDKLAYFRLREGIVSAGVYDFEKKRNKNFNFEVNYHFLRNLPIWISEDEAIFVAKSNSTDLNDRLDEPSIGPQRQSAARESAWRGDTVTASVLGAGRYFSQNPQPPKETLIRVNLSTGETVILGQQDYWDFELSSSGRYLATMTLAGNVNSQSENPISPGELAKTKRIVVYDLKDNRELFDCGDCEAATELLSWSPVADELLFFAHLKGKSKADGLFYRYDAARNTLNKIDKSHIGFIGGRKGSGRERDKFVNAAWIGESILFQQSDISTAERRDWILVTPSGSRTILTKTFSSPPREILAVSDSSIFFIVEGDVWRTDFSGNSENLSADRKPPLRRAKTGHPGLRSLRTTLNGVRSLSQTPLESIVADQTEIIFFNDEGDVDESIFLPEGSVSKLAISTRTQSVVYREDRIGDSSIIGLVGQQRSNVPITLFDFNAQLKGVYGGKPIKFAHDTGGRTLNSWILLPPGASEGVRYPTIVIPYAGAVMGDSWQLAAFSDTVSKVSFTASPQLLAAAGYAVLLPSIPLTSAPGDPMQELLSPALSAVDKAIELGYSDPNRIGLIGQSYGGYTTLALIAQTDRFKVAITSAGIANLTSHYGQIAGWTRIAPPFALPAAAAWSELGQGRMGSAPWTDPERYVRNSPLFHADKINTPLMLVHGDLDIINIGQAEEMYTALARQNKDVLFVRYWGEYHTIVSPANIRDMWERRFDWLQRYLGEGVIETSSTNNFLTRTSGSQKK